MYKLTHKRAVNGLFIGLLGSLLSLSGTAFAQLAEIEGPNGNGTAANAQLLCIPSGGVTVDAVMGTGSGTTSELDIFAFDAAAGDAPNIGVTSDMTWDSLLVLYDEAGNLLDQNDDYMFPNPDSRIDSYGIPVDGRYFATVVAVPNFLGSNFTPNSPGMGGQGGSYTLDISNVTASATTASTGGTASSGSCSPVADVPPPPDTDPGTDTGTDPSGTPVITMEVLHWRNQDGDVAKRWKHHMKRKGKRDGIYPIPVVMFSSETFKATNIDESSLAFGVDGVEDSLFRCARRDWDVNKDGLKDKVCFFDAFKTGFDVGDVQAKLNGEWYDSDTGEGGPFTSTATLKVFKVSKDKKKHKNWRKGHRHHDHNDGKHDRHKRARWSNQD